MTSLPDGKTFAAVLLAGHAGLAMLVSGCTIDQGTSTASFVQVLWIDGPQGKLRVEDGGSGEVPVLFVHGLAGNRMAWEAQLAHVRKTRRAIALDLHGMGESEPSPTNDYSIKSFADDVASVVDKLGLGKVVLVGHSMGGHVILAFAATHPERAAALLFNDPTPDLNGVPRHDIEEWFKRLEPETYDAFTEAWFGNLLTAAKNGVRERVLTDLRKTPRIVFVNAFRGLVDFDPKPALQSFKGPMLTIVTPKNKEPHSLQNLAPNLPVKEISGASHWIMMDKPDEFNAAMDAFLPSVPGK